jgi:hypothetical protein
MRYTNDPHWITARWAGVCRGCGHKFGPGARVFYYPLTKAMFSHECAVAEAQRAHDAIQDEDNYNGYGRY